MKVKELLEIYEGRFAILSEYGYELISSRYSFGSIIYSNGTSGLLQILDAEIAEFYVKNYHGYEGTLVIRIKEEDAAEDEAETLQNEEPEDLLQQGKVALNETIQNKELDDLLQQGAESIKEPPDDAVVLKAALDDFVAAVEKMATNESSAPELAAAMVVLYAIYKDLNRKEK